MNSKIEILNDYDIPTNSAIKAIRYLNEKRTLRIEDYNQRIKDLIPLSATFTDLRMARIVYLYLVQEIIKANRRNEKVSDAVLYNNATVSAKHVHSKNYYYADGDVTVANGNSNNKLTGKVRKKRQGYKEDSRRIFLEMKKEGAERKEVIENFIEKLGMPQNSAMSYFYMFKKEYGFNTK